MDETAWTRGDPATDDRFSTPIIMKTYFLPLASALLAVATAHAATPETITTDFKSGPGGWSAGFADYPKGSEKFYELQSGIKKLPSNLKLDRKGFFISGNNHSDDLCMFLTRRVTGLAPHTRYRVRFSVTFASASPRDSFGVGGSPAITVKAGVSHKRPSAEGKDMRLNIDKGNQSTGGRDAKVIGDTGVDVPSGSESYRMKTLANTGDPFVFETDGTGKGWLFVCTDSGFEATTSLYFTRISAKFIPR